MSNLIESNNTESNLKNEVFRTFYKKTKTYLNKDSNCWKSAKMRLGRRTSQRTVVITTDLHGLRRAILVRFLLLLTSFPSTASMTDLHRHNSPSRVFVPKHFNFWNMGIGITSQNFMTNLQDGP